MRLPGAISLITPKELKRDNDLSIAPVLNRVPGVYMQSGALNTSRITFRGIGARSLYGTTKIKAYLGNIPLTNGNGETSIDDLDLTTLRSIEIIRGPASVIYGAGLGGTLILHPENGTSQVKQLSQQTETGSFGLLRNVTSLNTENNKAFLSLSYNNTTSDGYRENNHYNRNGLFLSGHYEADEKNSIDFVAIYNAVRSQIPSSIDSTTYADNPRAAAANWLKTKGYEHYHHLLSGITLNHVFNPVIETHISLFTRFGNNDEMRPFNILEENNQLMGTRSIVQFNPRGLKKQLRITAGVEYMNERAIYATYANLNGEGVRDSITSDNREVRSYTNFFINTAYSITPAMLLTAGLNLNHTSYDYTDWYLADGNDMSGTYSFDYILSPRIAINYKVNSNLSFYGAASQGFSPPTLSETLTPDGRINPDIKPEQGWNYESGMRGSFFRQSLSLDISLYTMQIKDLLVAKRIGPDAFVGVNAGKTAHTGLETTARFSPNKLQTWNSNMTPSIFISYLYTHYRFVDFSEKGQNFSGNQLTGVPKDMLSAGIDVNTFSGFYGSLTIQHTGSMPMRDDNSIFSSPYSLLNGKLGYRRTLFNKINLDLYAGINNIFNEKYASMILVNAPSFGDSAPRYYYPGLPRNYYVSMKVGYLIR